MPHLNIKSDEAHRLATELAARRGSSLTDAGTAALGESLRVTGDPSAGLDALLAEVRQVQILLAEPEADDMVRALASDSRQYCDCLSRVLAKKCPG